MTRPAEPLGRRSLLEMLTLELAPHEGRWAACARIATGCTLTVALAMVFQIPQPTYMAYIVFAISKDEQSATVTSALGGLAAATLAVVLSLGLSLIDTAEPAVRLPLMAAATFVAMYTLRTFSLGPITYLAGFVIVLLQSLVDDVRGPEALIHAILWIWVVILVPVLVTVVVNVVFGQGAAVLTNRTFRKVLSQLEESLVEGNYDRRLAQWRSTLAPLLAMAGVSALLDALVILEAIPMEWQRPLSQPLAAQVRACRRALEARHVEAPVVALGPIGTGLVEPPWVVAFADALSRLRTSINTSGAALTATAGRARRLFVADAFKNPVYWQFALKTTLAVMVSYASYTLLDWPGTRTAIVTCFFVALSSLGETVHKLTLRLSGAIIGGAIAGVCIVFILPQLTDIGQLCLLIGAVSLGAAWVATSSELLSYAGMQIAFAFFLGILQGYAPATDLTVLRDRIVGIVLGNIVVTIIFSSFWPESTKSGIRLAISEALRAIASVIGRQHTAQDARARTVMALIRADRLCALSLFELRMLPHPKAVDQHLPQLNALERLAGAAFVATSASIVTDAEADSLKPIAQWADAAADCVSRGESAPPFTASAPGRAVGAHAEARRSVAQQAIDQLQSEVRHVASARP